MNYNKKTLVRLIIFTFLSILVLAGLIYFYNPINKKTVQNTFQNNVAIRSKVVLPMVEQEQLVKSVDAFMGEYKLPKGVQNSYTLSIEKRLDDAIEMIVNPGEEGDIGSIVIHARKTNNVWQVDTSGGPWCTLETFEDKSCF